jgi:hypothetical protein
MPAGFFGNAGDNVAVYAPADHQGGFKVADGREEFGMKKSSSEITRNAILE